VILDGVRSGAWRILVGDNARLLDTRVRARPEAAYDYAELFAGPVEAEVAAPPPADTGAAPPPADTLRT
jgi:hypothetical protein